MSHFTVLVIGKDWEEQLRPYNENTEDLDDGDKEFEVVVPAGKLFDHAKDIVKEAVKEKKDYADKYQKLMDKGDYEGILSSYHGGQKNDNGDWGYWHNPYAKWDWYVMGGRWSGYFKVKKGAKGTLGEPGVFKNKAKSGYVDQLRKGEVDWDGMLEDAKKSAEKNYDEFMKKFKASKKKEYTGLHFEYGVVINKKGKPESKKSYVKKCSDFTPFAVLKDGEWLESGNMGWFGISIDNKKPKEWKTEIEQVLKDVPDNELLTIVDCHI